MTDPSLDIDSIGPATRPGGDAHGSVAVPAAGPVVAIEPSQAARAVELDPAQTAAIDERVAGYLEAITTLGVHDSAFAERVRDIESLGDHDIRASAAVSNRLIDKPMAAMAKGGLSEASDVSRSLLNLRRTIEELDPARQGDLLSPRRILGIIPFGSRLTEYFRRYQSSQGHINAIVIRLRSGQDELRRDNASIEEEKANLWVVMGRLRQYAYLGQQLDAGLTARIATIEQTDPDRAKVLKEDLLFPVRRRVQDLLTQLAVSVHGFLALDLIRRNNTELIKGVDRATTTTISALRTAVIVAQALADQKLVLDQITAINTTTGDLIESTSELLRQQTGQVTQQAASSTIELGKLQAAFTNVYATMDEIDAFKLRALDDLSKTIDALSVEINKSRQYVERGSGGAEQAAAG
jgi:uncharacterized protein YaaN involved in tellurite resistance